MEKLCSLDIFVLFHKDRNSEDEEKESVSRVHLSGLLKYSHVRKLQLYLNILNVICLNMFVFSVGLKMFSPGAFEGDI